MPGSMPSNSVCSRCILPPPSPQVLSDEEKRSRYDRGEDVTGNPQVGVWGGRGLLAYYGKGSPQVGVRKGWGP